MEQRLSRWISAHTTPAVVIILLFVGAAVILGTGGWLLLSYPDFPDKAVYFVIAALGIWLVVEAKRRLHMNELMEELRKVIEGEGK